MFVAFMVLETIVSISQFQRKNWFEKWSNLAKDIFKNVLRLGKPNQTAGWKQFLIDWNIIKVVVMQFVFRLNITSANQRGGESQS